MDEKNKSPGFRKSTLVIWLLIVGATVALYLLSPGSGSR